MQCRTWAALPMDARSRPACLDRSSLGEEPDHARRFVGSEAEAIVMSHCGNGAASAIIPSSSAAATLAGLFAARRRHTLEPGNSLFRQGDAADRVFLIEDGRMRMMRHLASGVAVAVHTGRPGELFAEGALFAAVYQCDGLTVGTATVVACPKADMLAALEASPALGLELLERVTRQLHAARALIGLRDIRSARERVLRHLQLRSDAGGAVAIEGRLLDVAAELGLTHEAYYRALATLERQGAIQRSPRFVRLLQPALSPSVEATT